MHGSGDKRRDCVEAQTGLRQKQGKKQREETRMGLGLTEETRLRHRRGKKIKGRDMYGSGLREEKQTGLRHRQG